MHVVPYEEATVTVVERTEGRAVVRNYLGAVMEMGSGPQAFLAELGPGSRVSSHFHDIDQFQVFVKGKGRIGKDGWEFGSFHYADAFTPYGPIVPAEGSEMAFFTLRHSTSSGLYQMPDSRELIAGRRGRNVVSRFQPQEPTPGQVQQQGLLSLPEDGVQGDSIHLAPADALPGDANEGGGQYLLVLSGSLLHGTRPLQPLSLIFAQAGERIEGVVAGPEGCQVLRLRFPRPSAREGSDPQRLAERDMSSAYALPENYQ